MCPGGTCHNNPFTYFENAGGCSVQINDLVYVFGGLNGEDQPNQNLYAYNMTANTLMTLSSVNQSQVSSLNFIH